MSHLRRNVAEIVRWLDVARMSATIGARRPGTTKTLGRKEDGVLVLGFNDRF